MNRVFLSGNLTRDPEVRYTQAGKAYARVGIAVNRRYKDKDSVDFFNLVVWEKSAEFCGRYMRKGSRVLVEGRLQTNNYENKDGVKVNSVEIYVENIEFAGGKRAEDGDGSGGSNYSKPSSDKSGYSEHRAPDQSKKDDDGWGGEPIDPDDTPF
jgi:single-strand DNA-binding protein